jgi:hypothetical protein
LKPFSQVHSNLGLFDEIRLPYTGNIKYADGAIAINFGTESISLDKKIYTKEILPYATQTYNIGGVGQKFNEIHTSRMFINDTEYPQPSYKVFVSINKNFGGATLPMTLGNGSTLFSGWDVGATILNDGFTVTTSGITLSSAPTGIYEVILTGSVRNITVGGYMDFYISDDGVSTTCYTRTDVPQFDFVSFTTRAVLNITTGSLMRLYVDHQDTQGNNSIDFVNLSLYINKI